jgi:type IV pilus assembly protein PilX
MEQNSRGMALLVCLIFLLLLTIVGVASMQNATLQEKMAGNIKLKNESFQYAEAGLREGEALVTSSTTIQSCSESTTLPDLAAVTTGGTVACNRWIAASDGNSAFWIQKITTAPAAWGIPTGTNVTLYRVTATATVGNSTSTVESIYAFNPS